MTLLPNSYMLYCFTRAELVTAIKQGQYFFAEFFNMKVPTFKDSYTISPAKIVPFNLHDAEDETRAFIKTIHSNIKNLVTGLSFHSPILYALLKKYTLPDDTQGSLEKGLRNAAARGCDEDLKIFIHFVANINAKDGNLEMGKTALHWAGDRGHATCYQLLIDNGADDTISDAKGNKAVSPTKSPTALSLKK